MDNNKLIKHLVNIGLSEKQALIYSILLESGGQFPGHVSKKSGLNRSTTYKILMELKSLKLIKETEKTKKLFYFVDEPEELISFTRNEVKRAEERNDSAERLLPRLMDFFSSDDERSKINYLGGQDIFQKISQKITLSENSNELCMIWDPNSLKNKNISIDNLLALHKEFAKSGIHTREMMPENDFNRDYSDKSFINSKKGLTPKAHFIENLHGFNSHLFLFNDDTIGLIKETDNNFSATLITDKQLFIFFKKIFEMMWSGSRA